MMVKATTNETAAYQTFSSLTAPIRRYTAHASHKSGQLSYLIPSLLSKLTVLWAFFRDKERRERLQAILLQAEEAGSIGHLADFDHIVKIRRDETELVTSQSVRRLNSRIIGSPNSNAHFTGHLAVFIVPGRRGMGWAGSTNSDRQLGIVYVDSPLDNPLPRSSNTASAEMEE